MAAQKQKMIFKRIGDKSSGFQYSILQLNLVISWMQPMMLFTFVENGVNPEESLFSIQNQIKLDSLNSLFKPTGVPHTP